MASNLKFPKAGPLDMLALVIAGADFTAAKLHLFSNDITPNENTLLTDFVECVFTGYAAASLTWSAPFFDANGVPVSTPGEKLFVQTGATGDTCYGGYITNTAGTKLLAAGRITDAPFPFVVSGNALPITVKVGLGIGSIDPPPVP